MLFQGLNLNVSHTANSQRPKDTINKAVEDIILFFKLAHPLNFLSIEIVQEYLEKVEESSCKHEFSLTERSFLHFHDEIDNFIERNFKLTHNCFVILTKL